MKVKESFSKVGKWADKNSPTILLGLGIAGFVGTVVLAVRATPDASRRLEDIEDRLNELNDALDNAVSDEEKKSVKKEKVGTYISCAKDLAILYGPAAVLAGSSAVCLIKSHNIEHSRLTAVAQAYQISEVVHKEYKNKVLEMLGEKKEKDIHDAIVKERVKDNPPDTESEIYNSTIDTLCYDSMSGRYFRSNKTKLEQCVNHLNRRLLNEMYISLNEFYDEINLEHIRLGDDLGWNINESDIELVFTSMLSDEGVPILVVDYRIAPRYDYRNLH